MANVLFVATIAGGGGDLSFAVSALSSLVQCGQPIFYAVVAQSGRDALSLGATLASMLAHAGICPAGLHGCYTRGRDNEVVLASPPLPTLQCAAIIQGPLHLFDSAQGAVASLGLAAAASLPRLLTVREFGMQQFLPPSSSGPGAAQQASAGLGSQEWGVFGSLPCQPTPALPAELTEQWGERRCLGYFRTPQHGWSFGLLVATALLLEQAGSASQQQPVLVLAPLDALAAVEQGIRAHPGLLSAEAAQGSSSASTATTTLRLLPRSPQEGPCTAAAPSLLLTLQALDMPTLSAALPQPTFLALLSTSLCAAVTGDGSLNEALAVGVPFVYSCEPHKAALGRDLAAVAGGCSAVGALWGLCSSRAPGGEAWEALRQQLGGRALRQVFAEWSEGVLREKGGLGERLRGWVEQARA